MHGNGFVTVSDLLAFIHLCVDQPIGYAFSKWREWQLQLVSARGKSDIRKWIKF